MDTDMQLDHPTNAGLAQALPVSTSTNHPVGMQMQPGAMSSHAGHPTSHQHQPSNTHQPTPSIPVSSVPTQQTAQLESTQPKQSFVFNAPSTDASASASAAATHALANASLLALAPSLPTIKMSAEVYVTLLNATCPPLTSPSCCPPNAAYTHYLLLGTRDIVNDKLVLHVKSLVPFGSTDADILHAFISHLNVDGQTVLGWVAATRFDSIPLPQSVNAQQPLLEMACVSIATAYFDLFHSAALTALARNCEPLKRDSGLQNLSRFCVEACAFLQDCVGIVCVNRSPLMGHQMILPFDTPELMPYDVERRLAVIAPHLFAAIDLKLNMQAPTPTAPTSQAQQKFKQNETNATATSAISSSVKSNDPSNADAQKEVVIEGIPLIAASETTAFTEPLLPPTLPSLIKCHVLPHHVIHVLPEHAGLNTYLWHVFCGDVGAIPAANVTVGSLNDRMVSSAMDEDKRNNTEQQISQSDMLESVASAIDGVGTRLSREFSDSMALYEQEVLDVQQLLVMQEALRWVVGESA
ncbi:hypothetical protein CcCBS67573_g06623 [Chytriomyces confervae]|uniref:Uncharacterized protein n=1 Tax=Chytriomyces confervae TaxID=246404 RepID=A0A507F1L6_9FUNG|nr:hypothetical protein CcCBS67573_g06623 [Chytriomyces confervae]